MIATVRGRVLALRLDAAVIEVGGVGLSVHATPATLAGLRVGQEAFLETSLVVREEALTLYGFADADERDVFEAVQTVSGVGQRLALAMLAVHTPDGLRRAVSTEDHAALQRVPGIGRKGAQRIILELTDRLGPASAPGRAGAAQAPGGQDRRPEVVEALVGLGWNQKAAQDAVEQVVPADSGPVDAQDVAAVLRGALRALGGGRG